MWRGAVGPRSHPVAGGVPVVRAVLADVHVAVVHIHDRAPLVSRRGRTLDTLTVRASQLVVPAILATTSAVHARLCRCTIVRRRVGANRACRAAYYGYRR